MNLWICISIPSYCILVTIKLRVETCLFMNMSADLEHRKDYYFLNRKTRVAWPLATCPLSNVCAILSSVVLFFTFCGSVDDSTFQNHHMNWVFKLKPSYWNNFKRSSTEHRAWRVACLCSNANSNFSRRHYHNDIPNKLKSRWRRRRAESQTMRENPFSICIRKPGF